MEIRNNYGNPAHTVIIVLAMFLVFAVIARWVYPCMSANKKAMNGSEIKAMTDKIDQAKPGAVIVLRDGTLTRILHVNKEIRPGGSVSVNSTDGITTLKDINVLAVAVADVVNQDEPGYNELARRYMAGGHVEPLQPKPPQ